MNDVFASLNRWIKANKLTLHVDKINVMKFCTNNKTCVFKNYYRSTMGQHCQMVSSRSISTVTLHKCKIFPQ
jgi:hypothetical protein